MDFCKNCKFFFIPNYWKGNKIGQCLFLPPVMNPIYIRDYADHHAEDSQLVVNLARDAANKPEAWCLPVVDASSCCGQWRDKREIFT